MDLSSHFESYSCTVCLVSKLRQPKIIHNFLLLLHDCKEIAPGMCLKSHTPYLWQKTTTMNEYEITNKHTKNYIHKIITWQEGIFVFSSINNESRKHIKESISLYLIKNNNMHTSETFKTKMRNASRDIWLQPGF